MDITQRRVGHHEEHEFSTDDVTKRGSASRQRISDRTMALIYSHLSVFLFGFTAILGKLISYGSLFLVWHRLAYASMNAPIYDALIHDNHSPPYISPLN
jgi:hypothetical protein